MRGVGWDRSVHPCAHLEPLRHEHVSIGRPVCCEPPARNPPGRDRRITPQRSRAHEHERSVSDLSCTSSAHLSRAPGLCQSDHYCLLVPLAASRVSRLDIHRGPCSRQYHRTPKQSRSDNAPVQLQDEVLTRMPLRERESARVCAKARSACPQRSSTAARAS